MGELRRRFYGVLRFDSDRASDRYDQDENDGELGEEGGEKGGVGGDER